MTCIIASSCGSSYTTKNESSSSSPTKTDTSTSSDNNSTSSNSKSNTTQNSEKCVGNRGCISAVRDRFKNTGKSILGEEYLEDGKFGISFMDGQHPGAYNAVVFTDCNCNITNVDVSTIR